MYPELHHELGRGGGAERGAELGQGPLVYFHFRALAKFL